MPPFRDEQIIIIAPGSHTTLAQLGLPESFTPPKLRVKSCMFPAEKPGEWEPYKVRRLKSLIGGGENGEKGSDEGKENDNQIMYEEDPTSEDGAVWPIVKGKIVDWPCFFALMSHVYNTLNPPFHTPILLISQPTWTPREQEKLTQFFFERFKMPAFTIMDAAMAACYAYGVHTATVVDVGLQKTDITAIHEFLIHDVGRCVALPDCGGEFLTKRLLDLLAPKGFTWEMCEQLKKSPICEVLPPGTPLPLSTENNQESSNTGLGLPNGANGVAPKQLNGMTASGEVMKRALPDVGTQDDQTAEDENEGVLDVASIVAGGKMNEYLARKEKEKIEKSNAKKKAAADSASAPAKQVKLPNNKRERNTFLYEDHALLDALKDMNLDGKKMAEAQAALDEGPQRRQPDAAAGQNPLADGEANTATETKTQPEVPQELVKRRGPIRREIEVGVERFQAASGGILDTLADAIYRTVSSVEVLSKRSELWDSLIFVGNGARLKGFKDAVLSVLQNKYIISPSSATIFTSELPSNLSTPLATGANTPQPQLQPHSSTGVNPLLLAATTAQNPHLHPQASMPSIHSHNVHSSHGQSPTSIKLTKTPEYFPEWKDFGYDDGVFLGAQVAAKVLFVVDQGISKGYMTRPDYNEQGPQGIHDYSL